MLEAAIPSLVATVVFERGIPRCYKDGALEICPGSPGRHAFATNDTDKGALVKEAGQENTLRLDHHQLGMLFCAVATATELQFKQLAQKHGLK